MLERIAGKLLDSIEALAVEEISVTYSRGPGHQFQYLPIIVTNADLFVSLEAA